MTSRLLSALAWRQLAQEHIDREPMPWLAAIVISERLDAQGECSPSLAELASDMNASRSTAKRAVRRLEALGLLEVTVRKQKRSLHETSLYRATAPTSDPETPLHPSTAREPEERAAAQGLWTCPACGADEWWNSDAASCGKCGSTSPPRGVQARPAAPATTPRRAPSVEDVVRIFGDGPTSAETDREQRRG